MPIDFVLICLAAIIAISSAIIIILSKKIRKITKTNEDLCSQQLSHLKTISELENRYKANPSADCQMMLADLMAGKVLLKVERLDNENLFYFRR